MLTSFITFIFLLKRNFFVHVWNVWYRDGVGRTVI